MMFYLLLYKLIRSTNMFYEFLNPKWLEEYLCESESSCLCVEFLFSRSIPTEAGQISSHGE